MRVEGSHEGLFEGVSKTIWGKKEGKWGLKKNGEIDSIEEVSNKDLEIKKPIVKVQEADNIHSVN